MDKSMIDQMIKSFVKDFSSINGMVTKWRKPLIGYADALDSLFYTLKKVVSPSHFLPRDLLEDAQTVIAYFLPFEKGMVKTNLEGLYSSKEWAKAYVETNELIFKLNIYIKDELSKFDYNSYIIPATHNFNKDRLTSDWSHRHVAYIAGLGTFGLNNMLITSKGCAGRIGSIVTNLKIEPTIKNNIEYCLYKSKGICRKCIDRCPTGALNINFFDRFRCYGMLLENAKLYANYGLADVCGKCCVGLPCSFANPNSK
ncbi:MAG: epoxyqueuosine reductase [Deferribacterota bacterium]|nr:epoxyqueuosine reductase [Deferribacterota bacterium]